MKQLTDKQWTRISRDYAFMYTALRRIAAFETPERMAKISMKQWGLPPDEALEAAYENVLGEAKIALREVRKPFNDTQPVKAKE